MTLELRKCSDVANKAGLKYYKKKMEGNRRSTCFYKELVEDRTTILDKYFISINDDASTLVSYVFY